MNCANCQRLMAELEAIRRDADVADAFAKVTEEVRALRARLDPQLPRETALGVTIARSSAGRVFSANELLTHARTVDPALLAVLVNMKARTAKSVGRLLSTLEGAPARWRDGASRRPGRPAA